MMWACLFVVWLALSSCTPAGSAAPSSTVGPTPTATPRSTPTATPTATPTPSPTATPTPSPTPTATPLSQTWHAAVVAGSASGDFGTLTYAPGGLAYVQYSVVNSGNWALSNVVQSGGGFAAATSISANDRLANLHFVDANTIWASAESSSMLHVYKSTNAGSTWTLQTSYAALQNGATGPAWDRSGWLDLGSGNLQIYFGVVYHHAVFGDHSEVHTLTYSGAAWAGSDVAPALATNGPMIGVLTSGNQVLLSNGNVNYSSDGGSTFVQEQSSGTADQNILGTGGVTLAAGSIYAVSTYTYGPAPNYYYFAVWKSTDFGATWSKVYTSPGAAYSFDMSSIAAVGNLVVVQVVREESDGSGSPKVLQFIASPDAGVTWTAPSQIIDVSSLGNYHIVNLQLAASSNGRIGSVYSLEPGAAGSGFAGAGVYFSEFY